MNAPAIVALAARMRTCVARNAHRSDHLALLDLLDAAIAESAPPPNDVPSSPELDPRERGWR